MKTPSFHKVHFEFPGLPAKALQFFHVSNVPKRRDALLPQTVPRTVAEFASEVSRESSTPNLREHPPYHRINLILSRLADFNLLEIVSRGSWLSHDASYLCTLSESQIRAVSTTLDFVVYGFQVIYEELRNAVVPIVYTSKTGDEQIGTAFRVNDSTLLTAAHCVRDAAGLRVKGMTKDHLRAASFAVTANEALDIAAIHSPIPFASGERSIELALGEILDEVLILGYPNVPGFTELIAAEKATISTRLTGLRGSIASQATEIFSKSALFLVTARVRGGFSGGPVLNSSGKAVGIVSRQPYSRKSDDEASAIDRYDNLGYGVAIPTEEIDLFLRACKRRDLGVVDFLDTSRIAFDDY